MKREYTEENSFFDTQAVKTAQPVEPLSKNQSSNANVARRIHVPVQAAQNRFSPLVLGLIAVLAVGAFAGMGTYVYRASESQQTMLDDAPLAAEVSAVFSDEGRAKQAPVNTKIVAEKPKKNPTSKSSVQSFANETETAPADDEFFDISEEEFEQRRQDSINERREQRKWERRQRKNKRAERNWRDQPDLFDEF